MLSGPNTVWIYHLPCYNIHVATKYNAKYTQKTFIKLQEIVCDQAYYSVESSFSLYQLQERKEQ